MYALNGQNAFSYKGGYVSDNQFFIENNFTNEVRDFVLDKKLPYKFSNYTIGHNDNSFILISNISSEVYREYRDTLRYFGSNQHHYALQFSPYVFVDNLLYSFGGYGFWTTKNILRYWNDIDGWVPIAFPESSTPLIPAHSSSLYYSEPFLYIIGGRSQSEGNALISHPIRALQKINLVTKEILIEDLPVEYSVEKLIHKYGDTLVFKNDDQFILFKITTNKAVLIEPTEKYIIASNQSDLFLKGSEFRNNAGLTYPFDELFHVQSNKGYQAITFIILALGIVIIIVIVFKSTNRSKDSTHSFILAGENICFGLNSIKLEHNEVLILMSFKNSESNKIGGINALLPDILSESHRNKLRSGLIKSINNKAQKVSGHTVDELLQQERCPDDSRTYQYRLSFKLDFQDTAGN
ncbi:MAG: hypothetical protein P8N00_03300 [Flavobacteriales bacterium]|nr:hypothetical protein [Flavobacteriales bacterium]